MRKMIILTACICGLGTYAELPLSLDDALFKFCGGADYDDYAQWMKTDGVIVFKRSFIVFNKALFRMYYPTNDFAPRHYSIEMNCEIPADSTISNIVGLIRKGEDLLMDVFTEKSFNRELHASSYRSWCENIDGLGWDASFSCLPVVKSGETTYAVSVKFYNQAYSQGRFTTCEDLSDLNIAYANSEKLILQACAGLDVSTMKIAIIEKSASGLKGALCYYKIRVAKTCKQSIVDKIAGYPKFSGEMSINRHPSWWRESPPELHFVCLTNFESRSQIICLEIEEDGDDVILYIAAIPI